MDALKLAQAKVLGVLLASSLVYGHVDLRRLFSLGFLNKHCYGGVSTSLRHFLKINPKSLVLKKRSLPVNADLIKSALLVVLKLKNEPVQVSWFREEGGHYTTLSNWDQDVWLVVNQLLGERLIQRDHRGGNDTDQIFVRSVATECDDH